LPIFFLGELLRVHIFSKRSFAFGDFINPSSFSGSKQGRHPVVRRFFEINFGYSRFDLLGTLSSIFFMVGASMSVIYFESKL